MRPLRHQVRKHFLQLGGGLVSAGLWIFPAYLREEVLQVLGALEVRSYATVFTTQTPDFPEGAAQAARQWWDLGRLESLHSTFLASTAALDAAPESPAAAYRGYVALVDAWRALPYLDPGLPDSMLPGTWPGRLSRERFLALSRTYEPAARQFARDLLGG
jgi:phenylacetic acid degradation operon negative regulatory protein